MRPPQPTGAMPRGWGLGRLWWQWLASPFTATRPRGGGLTETHRFPSGFWIAKSESVPDTTSGFFSSSASPDLSATVDLQGEAAAGISKGVEILAAVGGVDE